MRRPERIYILDCDDETRFFLDETLGIYYHLEFFDQIKTFCEKLYSVSLGPQLVIADLKLKDGYFTDFLMSKKEQENDFDFPFIIISTIDDQNTIRFCYDNGALDYLVKPFRKGELLVKVERYLDKASIIKEAAFQKKFDRTQKQILQEITKSDDFTIKEIKILETLVRCYEQPLKKDEILKEVWGKEIIHPNSLEMYFTNIHPKLKKTNWTIISCGDQSWCLQPAK